MPGKYFDEWRIGETIEHPLRRTVTETDNLLWSTMTHNPQALHLDAEAAKASEFGRILVNGTFTFSLMVGITVAETTMGTLVANLGYDKLIMPKPVFIGDTLHATSEVTELRESKSRPNAGLVTWKHRMHNQRDDVVCECLRTALLLRKGDDLHEIGEMLAEFVSGLAVPNDPAAGWWRVLFTIFGLLALIALTFWLLVH